MLTHFAGGLGSRKFDKLEDKSIVVTSLLRVQLLRVCRVVDFWILLVDTRVLKMMSDLDIKLRQIMTGSAKKMRTGEISFFLKNVGECDETFIWTSQEILKTQHSVSRKLMLLTNVHINSVYECLLDLVRLLMSLQHAGVSVYLLRIMLLWPTFVDYLSWKEKRRFVTSRVLIEILWWRKIVVSSSEVITETFCEDRRSEWW